MNCRTHRGCWCLLQARLADAEEDKAELQGRAEALAQRLKEAELAATSARSEAQRSQERASALDEDLHATEATLAAVQEQLSHALQVCPHWRLPPPVHRAVKLI